jgi:uncharacterized protein YndB with AHSA1/START domain
MITFNQSGIINAPIEKVFAYISDPQKIPEWRKDVPGISQISGAPNAGATFYEDVNFMGKKKLLMKIIEFIPNKKIVIEAQSGMALLPTQEFTFTPQGNQTRVDLVVIMRVSGLFTLLQPMLPTQLKKTWAGYFQNLNQILTE